MADYGKSGSIRFLKTASSMLLLAATVLIAGCGGDEPPADSPAGGPDVDHLTSFEFRADTLLPGDIETYDLKQTTPPINIRPDSLGALSGAHGAALLSFNCIGLTTTEYLVRGTTVKVELAQFAQPQDAFGMYAGMRPNGARTEQLGTESFQAGDVRYVLQGEYLMTLSVPDGSDTSGQTVGLLAQEILSRLTTESRMPAFHILFPSRDKISSSNRYFAYNYLGITGLDEVYTTDYLIRGDTVRLFLTVDTSGIKFLQLKNAADESGRTVDVPRIFDFDSGFAVSFEYAPHGRILGGLARQKLVGVIGYNSDTQESKIARWVKGLQQ